VSDFDPVAASFERDRALPTPVSAAIRRAVLEHGSVDPRSPLLEVGCGTGRIGAEFCIAGDDYLGVDFSTEMLREFQRRKFARPPRLVRADGGALPFGDGTFEAVMMMHVLTAGNWPALLTEACRVLRERGVLVIGKAEDPADGIDAAMRQRLNELLADMGIAEPKASRGAMDAWLRSKSSRHLDVTAAAWTATRRPREFFLRKRSAARFGSLPAQVREAALQSLAEWTERSIGPLDTPRHEPHHFRLQLYWF
jgi:ubiquinone/menaquinone biosynthesis C-methylase UbiE